MQSSCSGRQSNQRKMADKAFQVRSISLPAESHPVAAQIEEVLRKLRASVVSRTAEAVCSGVRGLGDFYNEIDELLRLPSNQRTLSHTNQRQWVEGELELSLLLLDLSSAVRDGLAAAREHLQDVQIGLRSKRKAVSDYNTLQSAKKTIASSLRSLFKQIERGSSKKAPFSSDGDLLLVVAALVEARGFAFSVLQSASDFAAAPGTKPKGSRWLILSKALYNKEVSCEAHGAEIRHENSAACSNQIHDIENGIESLFRRLIQIRVSLLNILSF